MQDHDESRKTRKLPKTTMLMLCGAATLMLAATALLLIPTDAPVQDNTATQAVSDATCVESGCELYQTLSYSRCEHTVTRRVTAPVELTGKTLDEVRALYPEWTITDFAPKEIKMEQQPQIHCPDHMVLMPDGAGRLCVFQNKYGDALALVSELTTELKSLPAAVQEEVKPGLGFSTLDELEQWLESAES